jgi:hypothetical protein
MFALDLSGDRLAELVNAVVENRIRVVIDRKVALTDFRDAWVRQQSGHARAKTVLIPDWQGVRSDRLPGRKVAII